MESAAKELAFRFRRRRVPNSQANTKGTDGNGSTPVKRIVPLLALRRMGGRRKTPRFLVAPSAEAATQKAAPAGDNFKKGRGRGFFFFPPSSQCSPWGIEKSRGRVWVTAPGSDQLTSLLSKQKAAGSQMASPHEAAFAAVRRPGSIPFCAHRCLD